MWTTVRAAYNGDAGRSIGLLPVVALVDRLRAGGVPVSTGEIIDAVAAVDAVGLDDRSTLHGALRGTLVKDVAHTAAFDRAFAAVFPRLVAAPPVSPIAPDGRDLVERVAAAADRESLAAALDDAVEQWSGTDEGRSTEHHVQRVLRRMDLWRLHRLLMESGDSDLERALRAAEADERLEEIRRLLAELVAARLRLGGDATPAADEALEDVALLTAGPDEIAALRAVLRPLARRLASRLGRRARRRATGTLDMRRTIRRSMGTGGVPIHPALRRRRPSRPDVAVLCDVSGSTAQFAPFMLGLLHAVHQEFRDVRSFVFVDGVAEVTDLLRAAPGVLDPRHLLSRRGLVAHDGRSDYALALGAFLDRWPDAVGPYTTVLVAGDARSHDRPPALPQLAALGRAARRLYWLNPEPRREWDTADSALSDYAAHCTDVFEVATLRQLADAVARIA